MIINGSKGTWEQPGAYGRDESGGHGLLVYEGTIDEIDTLADTVNPGLPFEVTKSLGKARLEVRLPYRPDATPASDSVVRWELFAQTAEKDLLDARVENATVIGALSQGQIQTIRAKLLDPPDGTSAKPYPTGTDFRKSTPQETESSGTNALNVHNLMQKGVRSYPVEVPTLRRTIITNSQYGVAYALNNVRKIISSTTLSSSESMPAALLFTMPAETSADTDYAYGWYKHFPTCQEVALQKWQIVQEWTYGLWATLIWGQPL